MPNINEKNYAVVVSYSFDSECYCKLFKTREEAIEYARFDMNHEYDIDTKENGWLCAKNENEDEGVFMLMCMFADHDDITTWQISEIIHDTNMDKTHNSTRIMNEFYWDKGIRQGFEKLTEKVKNNKMDEVIEGEFIGCARIGELCFDMIVRYYGQKDNEFTLDYDCYVGGVDVDYGYTEENHYPYAENSGGSFDTSIFTMTFEEFKNQAEKEMRDFIMNYKSHYQNVSLVKKANEPLHCW